MTYFGCLVGCLPTLSDVSPLNPLVCTSGSRSFSSQFQVDCGLACLAVFIAFYGHVLGGVVGGVDLAFLLCVQDRREACQQEDVTGWRSVSVPI